MAQNMKEYLRVYGDGVSENDEKMVCCFCKKALEDSYFIDDTGRIFCHRQCRQMRIWELKNYADKGRTL